MYSLNAADQQCQRIITNCQSKGMHVSCGEMRDDLRELRRRFEDDFKATFSLQLTAKQAAQFQDPMKEWGFMYHHFSKVRFNVEECMKCFALERYCAAVFHILQVAEYGVIKVTDLLQVSGDKPGWGSLRRLSAILEKSHSQRSDLEKLHSKLLEDVVPLSVVMKDSWRHKLDHVDNQIIRVEKDFSAEAAEEIISATRAFMRKLSGDLQA